MSDLWAARVRELSKKQRAEAKAAVGRVDSAMRWLKMAEDDFARVRAELVSATDAAEARLAALDAMRDDPVVLVRRYAAGSAIYHDARRPCGWVRDPDSMTRLLLGEALAEGLAPCSACGYRAEVGAAPGRALRSA